MKLGREGAPPGGVDKDQVLRPLNVPIGCWLPVVHIQIRMRDLAADALLNKLELPPACWRYFRAWIALGIPAFFAFVVIFYLMVAKPA